MLTSGLALLVGFIVAIAMVNLFVLIVRAVIAVIQGTIDGIKRGIEFRQREKGKHSSWEYFKLSVDNAFSHDVT